MDSKCKLEGCQSLILQKKVDDLYDEWVYDHRFLRKLCLKAGYDEDKVMGDNYGVPCIQDLAQMLFDKTES